MEALERLQAFLEEGSYQVLGPLILVAFLMFVIVAERSIFYFGSVTGLFWPPARRRMRDRQAEVADAFEDYVESPSGTTRAQLVRSASRLPTPFGRFLVRAFGRGSLPAGRLRELHLQQTSLQEALEIEKGLSILSALAKSAPLLGLLGTVIGMIQTFRAMMVASTSDPRALSSGISIALIATEVGLIVALPGVISMSGLSRRAESLEEEIHLAAMRLKQVTAENRTGGVG
jgi:biopolymer transport protein ExbB